MPDSWQELDGDGVLMDWTSAGTIRLCDTYHAFNAVERAYHERYFKGSGGSWSYIPSTIDRLSDYSYLQTAMTGVYRWMTGEAFASQFVDLSVDLYSDNGSVPWREWLCFTTSRIASYIGESVSPVPNIWHADNAAWLWQTYRILNALKCTHTGLTEWSGGYPPNFFAGAVSCHAKWTLYGWDENVYCVGNMSSFPVTVDVYSGFVSGSRVLMQSGIELGPGEYTGTYSFTPDRLPLFLCVTWAFNFRDW